MSGAFQWVFSGIGVAILGWLGTAAWRSRSRSADPPPAVHIGSATHTQVTIHTGTGAVQQALSTTPTAEQESAPPVHIKRVASVTLKEIRDAVDEAPPLQRADIIRRYIGLNVQWEASLSGAGMRGDDEVRVHLKVGDDCGLVYCTVRLSEYRELGILREGAHITVSGRIAELDSLFVGLEDVELFFTEAKDQR